MPIHTAFAQWLSRARPAAPRSDEREQAVFRLVFVGLLLVYLLVSPLMGAGALLEELPALALTIAYLLFGFLVLVAIQRSPHTNHLRHTTTMVCDVAATTACMQLAGEKAAVLYVIYLWLSVGNGFRYGTRWLALCTALSVVGFGTLLYTSAYWSANRALGMSLLLGLVVLPLFAVTLIGRLNHALRRAEAASDAKTRFVAHMSHEIRTPLNGVLGLGRLLLATPLTPLQKDYLNTMIASSLTLQSQIDKILDLGKVEAGQVDIRNAEFDLAPMLYGLINMLQPVARGKHLRLMLHIAVDTPLRLVGDATHLRQVLTNIVGNAIKFTTTGFVDVRVRSVQREGVPAQIVFEIEDSGIGIPHDALERIWEPYQQADVSTTRNYGGTGLGTTIARQLITLMGGTIRVASTEGTGSLFCVSLPYVPATPAEVRFTGLRVLVLGEGEWFPRTRVRSWGVTVLEIASEVQGLAELVRAAQENRHFHVLVARQGDGSLGAKELIAFFLREPLLADHTQVVIAGVGHKQQGEMLRDGFTFAVDRSEPELISALHASLSVSHALVAESVSPGLQSAVSGLRILVAEDNATNRMVMRGLLEMAGHRVTIATDGEAALDAIEAGDIDLVIIDMMMPRMSGLDVIKYIRFQRAPYAKLPVIVLTANATQEARDECLRAGANTFVTKPVDPGQLNAEIARLFASRTLAPLPSTVPRPLHESTVSEALDRSALDGLSAIGQSPTFVRLVIERFVDDALRAIESIQSDVRAARFASLRENLHALRGSAMYVGAVTLATTIAGIEQKSDDELAHSSSQLLHDLVAAFESTRSALNAYLEPPRQSDPYAASGIND